MGLVVMKNKNIEMRIYEMLGVKTFRKLAYKLVYLISFIFIFSKSKEERINLVYRSPSNYNMRKGNGLQDLKDFKKMLFLNAAIHTFALFRRLSEFFDVINGVSDFSLISLLAVFINLYCIMLQRYNHIRINQILKKGKGREERQKVKLLEELKQEQSLPKNLSFKIVDKRDKNLNMTFEEYIESASLEELKAYKKALEFIEEEYKYLNFLEKYEVDNKVQISKNRFIKVDFKSEDDFDKTLKK